MNQKSKIARVLLISALMLSLTFTAISLQAPANAATTATFGNTHIGNYTDRTPVGDKDSCRYKAPEDGILTSISMYILTGNTQVRYGVYDDLNGQPNNLLGQSDLVTTTANSWVTASLTVPVTAGKSYWLTVTSTTMVYWTTDAGAAAGNG